MKTTLMGLVCALLACPAFAQKSPIKFGDIPMEDMKMTSYALDTSASAVVLADYGEAYITATAVSANLNFERHVRIKILKKEGLEWADAEIPLYHSGSDEEKVSKLKAATYNLENGAIVKSEMSKDGIFKEKFNKEINLQKFTLPNVKEGSVIEYSYTIYSEFITNFPNWEFQYDIPVRHSEYWAIFPDLFIFEKYMQGYIAPTSYVVEPKNTSGLESHGHHWICKNVPAFREEPFMTTERDYLSKINFALAYINYPGMPSKEVMGTWTKLNNELLEYEGFGKAITGSGFLKKKVDELTAGVTDPEEKARIIHGYVRDNLEWDGSKDYLTDGLKKVFEVKKGTAADINLALASMLDKAGIPVEMVLLSTRDHGFIRQQYPMERQFNYTVCSVKLGDKTILMDATDKYLPMHVIPSRCLNGEGLLVTKGRESWIRLEPKAKSKTVINADLTLTPEGELKGKVDYVNEGYNAEKVRSEYFSKGEEEYLKKFLAQKTWQVEKTEFANTKDIGQPVKQMHELVISDQSTVAGDVVYINPFVSHQLKENVFKLDKREYPIDFGSPQETTHMIKFTIPDGYTVDEMPQSKAFMMPGNAAKYLYSTAVTGNVLTITSILTVNKILFQQTEYPQLREFYNQVVAKQAEQLVLKKK